MPNFWQLVKAFRFEAKKIEAGDRSTQAPFEAFRVKYVSYEQLLKKFQWHTELRYLAI